MRILIALAAAALLAGGCAARAPQPGEPLEGTAVIVPDAGPRLVVLTAFEQRVLPLYGRLALAQRTAAEGVRTKRLTPAQGEAVAQARRVAVEKLRAAEVAEAQVRSGAKADPAARLREATAAVDAVEKLAR